MPSGEVMNACSAWVVVVLRSTARGSAIALPRAVERNTATTQAEQAFIESTEGRSLAAARGHTFAPPAAPGEIGAATAIEFRGKRFIAAAEPQRRGGGSAMVVRP